jgi:hypothetical protein
MRELGVKNFSISVLDTAQSFEELKEKEKEHILRLRSYDEDIGYNMSIETDDGLEIISEDSLSRKRHSLHRAQASRRKGKYGIGVRKTNGTFYANLTFNGTQYNLPFATQTEASIAYDKLSIYFHGSAAVINSPELSSQYSDQDLADNYLSFKEVLDRQCSSKFFGVCHTGDTYSAIINKDKVSYFLGRFSDEVAAAKTVDRARAYLYGKNSSKFNFPEDIDVYLNDTAALAQWFDSMTKRRTVGLHHDKRINKWGASVVVGGKRVGLGYYEGEEQAAKVRDMAALHFNLDLRLNYPECEEEMRRNATGVIEGILGARNRYKGVYWSKEKQAFHVNCGGRYIKTFHDEVEAAHAYDEAAKKRFGDKARLNFPVRS